MSLATGRDSTPPSCPCGSRRAYADCCAAYVEDGLPAPTAETLMRSRYTAYARGNLDHVFRTWHPRTRPADLELDPRLAWTGLTVLRSRGGESDEAGEVEFRAGWRLGDQSGVLHEVSRFGRRAGRWVYVDGEQP